MANHPNRNITTIDTLRTHLVPVTKKIKKGEFSNISLIHGERLLLISDWESQLVYVTITKGPYGPPRLHEGLEESFELKHLFSADRSIDEVIGFTGGEPGATRDQYNNLYQDYILDAALAAQEVLENAPEDVEVSDDIKTQVRALLMPYLSMYND